MMQRRKFLIWSSVLGFSPYLGAKNFNTFDKSFKHVEATIMAVQEHMLPKHSKIPDASSMQLTQFLFETITHKSFDKDIKMFVIEGAKKFQKRENNLFINMNTIAKEKALRAYENTHYGSAWLSRILTLTMEGVFSDPIYGANKQEAGWKALHSYGGIPRPKTKYLES